MLRLLAAGLTLCVVHTTSDGWKVLGLQALGAAVASGIAITQMYRENPFQCPRFRLVKDSLGMGRSMFLFCAASSLYASANGFILGLFQSPLAVGFYGGAERIHRPAVSPFAPFSMALYPHMVRTVMVDLEQAKKLARRILAIMLVLGIVGGMILFVGAPLWTRLLLGPGYEPTVKILRVFALQIPLTAVSRILGLQWLLPRRQDVAFNTVVICAAAVNLALAFLLVPSLGAMGVAISFVTAETVVTGAMACLVQGQDRLLWNAVRRS